LFYKSFYFFLLNWFLIIEFPGQIFVLTANQLYMFLIFSLWFIHGTIFAICQIYIFSLFFYYDINYFFVISLHSFLHISNFKHNFTSSPKISAYCALFFLNC